MIFCGSPDASRRTFAVMCGPSRCLLVPVQIDKSCETDNVVCSHRRHMRYSRWPALRFPMAPIKRQSPRQNIPKKVIGYTAAVYATPDIAYTAAILYTNVAI